MKGSWNSSAMWLELVAGREIAVYLDEDGLIYWADEYDCTGYKLGHWQADAE